MDLDETALGPLDPDFDLELPPFYLIPQELILKIWSHVHPDFLLSNATVCKTWNELLNNQNFWFRMCCRLGLVVCSHPDNSSIKDWKEFLKANTTIHWETSTNTGEIHYSNPNFALKLDNYPDISVAYSSTCAKQGKRLIIFNIYEKRDELLVGLTDDPDSLITALPHQFTNHARTWALFDGSRYSILQTGGRMRPTQITYGTGDSVGMNISSN